MVDFKVLEKNLPRIDASEKVTGRAVYAADVYLPGMLMCKLLPSARAHARIVWIDKSRADNVGYRPAPGKSQSNGRGSPIRYRRESVPLHRLLQGGRSGVGRR